MKNYHIQVIAGDGIGVEVTEAAMRVVERAATLHGFEVSFTEQPWGSHYFFEHGRMMPANALEALGASDAILLGAVGHPDIPDHVTLHGLLLPIRRTFDQFANVRPAVLFDGVESPLRGYPPHEIDMVVVRENTEGEYAPVGGFVHHHHKDEVAIQTAVFTRHGCERVIRYAFDLARRRNKKNRVTSVTKSNAQAYSLVLWDRVFTAVAADYPDIETESLLVDAAAMNFVRRPHTFDVVVASNRFGDILSDVSAIVTGSIGLAASANIDPTRRFPSLFEPVHGSAPDIAGQGIANPIGQIWSASLMLDWLGHRAAAAAVLAAIEAVLAAGPRHAPLTRDIGGTAGTTDLGRAIAQALI